MKRLFAVGIFAVGATLFWGASVSSAAPSLQTINASTASINNINQTYPDSCGEGLVPQAQFIITQIDTASDAPSSISVTFEDSTTAVYQLEKFTGGSGHYVGDAPALIDSATTQIYSSWSGTFVLSDFSCGASSGTTTTTTTTTVADTTTTTTDGNTTTTTTDGNTTTTEASTTTVASGGTTTTSPTTAARTASGGGSTTTTVAKAKTSKAVKTKTGLAFTGSNSGLLITVALILMALGGLGVLASRRLPATASK